MSIKYQKNDTHTHTHTYTTTNDMDIIHQNFRMTMLILWQRNLLISIYWFVRILLVLQIHQQLVVKKAVMGIYKPCCFLDFVKSTQPSYPPTQSWTTKRRRIYFRLYLWKGKKGRDKRIENNQNVWDKNGYNNRFFISHSENCTFASIIGLTSK